MRASYATMARRVGVRSSTRDDRREWLLDATKEPVNSLFTPIRIRIDHLSAHSSSILVPFGRVPTREWDRDIQSNS